MDRRIGRIGVILAVVLGASRAVSAYPIAPRTLWDLVGEAERIVLARVDDVTHRTGEGDTFESSLAHLEVLETWKGTPASRLEVAFTEGLICPAPDRYIEGEVVLAFLESGEARLRQVTEEKARRELAGKWSGLWFTVALSYGTLYPEPDAVPAFRQLVADALDLRSHGSVSEADRRQWLVRAAVHPATRWHGLYELARTADPIHSFYDRRPAPPDLAAALTRDERAALAAAFYDAPLLDRTVPMMLKVLAGYPSRDVDLRALAAVETALGEKKIPFWVHEAMPLVRARFGDVPKVQRSKPKKGKDCNLGDDPLLRSLDRTDDQIRRDWAQARERLGLPSVERLPRPLRPNQGVGADTPS